MFECVDDPLNIFRIRSQAKILSMHINKYDTQI